MYYFCRNIEKYARYQASTAVWLRSSLLLAVARRRLQVGYRRFGST